MNSDRPDPLQGHTREWPSTPYSDEARLVEPPFETSCCIGLFGDCTVHIGFPPAMRPESHLAARLNEQEVWERFAVVAPAGQRERDVWLGIRQGAGEHIDELAATRDLLHVSTLLAQRNDSGDSYPEWTGVTNEERTVTVQLEAAREMLRRLQSAKAELEDLIR